MEDFNFFSPTYFSFGKNKEEEVGKLVRKFGGTKVLIHFGLGSVKKTGLLDRVIKSLQEQDIVCAILGGVRSNPRSGLVYTGIEICKKEGFDFILAVGGGSVIDSAKAIAIGSMYEGDFWDFYSGKEMPEKALPIGTILTIAAAGSEGSGDSVITLEKGMLKRSTSGDCIRPKFSILNPELTETLSNYQTACGITDIMAHVFERYFTNTKNVECTDRLCEAILLTMKNQAQKVLNNPKDYEARANIMWAGMVAHNNIVGVGREQDWNSHAIEHELSAKYDCAHGAGLAVIMPAWMKYVVDHDVNRFVQIAIRLWNCPMDYDNPKNTALMGIESFRQFLSSIGMPTSFAEIGAKEEDIPELIEKLGIGGNKTGGFMKLDKNDIELIYRLAI